MTKEDMINLYDKSTLKHMHVAEEATEAKSHRVKEIHNYAKSAGIKRIGIANCIAFQKEANTVKDYLSSHFEVYSIDCKCGKISKNELLGIESAAIICNPLGQAAFLKENNTEINISMGLCVGHDIVFNSNSAAPVTSLLVKDRANRNNPMDSFKELTVIGEQ
jgi:uncharacterized metal-binding protein